MRNSTSEESIQYWSLPGTVENWGIAAQQRVWGMKAKFAKTWQRLSGGDVLFFYAKSPVGGIIGHGHVAVKFKGQAPLWPDEIRAGRVIYPYRFEFEVTRLLDPQRWSKDRIPVRDLGMGIRLMGLVPAAVATRVLERIHERWGEGKVIREVATPYFEKPVVTPPEKSRHDVAKELLVEIGQLRRWLADKEYSIDSERLDVVWRKVEKGVPRYVFEVQIGGDIYHALGKLKHASDLWGSKIFLVIDKDSISKVEELLSGTFHEIADQLRVVQLERLEMLQQALETVHALENELSLV